MTKIIINGAGSYLAKKFILSNRNNYKFVILTTSKKVLKFYKKEKVSGFKINKNARKSRYILSKIKGETLINFAACTDTNFNEETIENNIKVNILYNSLIIFYLSKKNPKLNCLNLLSYYQYNLNKKKNFEPNSFYASSKQSFHNILYFFYIKKLIHNFCNLILFDVYGVDDKRKKLIYDLIFKKKIKIKNPNNFLYLINEKDYMIAINKILNKLKSKKIFCETFSTPFEKVQIKKLINFLRNKKNKNKKMTNIIKLKNKGIFFKKFPLIINKLECRFQNFIK